MVTRSYFGHVTPNGVDALTRILSAGYTTLSDGLTPGENIVAGSSQGHGRRADELARAPREHPQRLVHDDRRWPRAIGVPLSLGLGAGGATYTQFFAAAP